MNWNGFCEVESEPVCLPAKRASCELLLSNHMQEGNNLQAFFNVMLRELGVQGAKFQEVISLDDEVLGLLP